MTANLTPNELTNYLSEEQATQWCEKINSWMQKADSTAKPNDNSSKIILENTALNNYDPDALVWQKVYQQLLTPAHSFKLHLLLYQYCYQARDPLADPGPAWLPTSEVIEAANLTQWLKALQFKNYAELYQWSIHNRNDYWQQAINALNIQFKLPYTEICNLNKGVTKPSWLHGAQLNIVDSCFQAPPSQTAIYAQSNDNETLSISYGDLEKLTNRVANSLVAKEFKPGDAIAIDMPMSIEAVAIYLGILKAGCAAIAVAESFAPQEIQTRLEIANAKAIFTQDVIIRGHKQIPLYAKVLEANPPTAIVLANAAPQTLREKDILWQDFLSNNDKFESIACAPHDVVNILFSSGTTSTPKAIPWDHTTPIKAAIDAHLHHDIHKKDILCWPTSLGWMMGPWLIFASLMNRAAMALYYDAPNTKEFCEFVSNNKITFLGVVPSLVKAWRHHSYIESLDWQAIRAFGSTGESSSPEDMLFLMAKAGYKPVIEYCGGTEIGGAYISSTLLQPAIPSTFSTPTLGVALDLLDENQQPNDTGEVALIPPSIGLSRVLLNKDHHEVYYQGMPLYKDAVPYRRHGDQMQRLANGYYRAQGRADDTMNLGGIKVSSAEIERCLNQLEELVETAAIAVPTKGGGPEQLIIYYVAEAHHATTTAETLLPKMQKLIATQLNPLFKISQILPIKALPRTSSNKVMRRVLRDQFEQ